MKRLLITGLVFLTVGLIQAHEFWLMPRKFRLRPGDQLTVDFLVGEGFEGTSWDLKRHQVEHLEVFNRFGKQDLTASVKPAQGANFTYALSSVGTYVIALQSDTAFIRLDAEKFNEYLAEDGLDNIIDLRKQSGAEDRPSREFYRRYAKLIVQSGDRVDDTYKQAAGLRLEITPLQNPYGLHPGDYLMCRVDHEGKPEPHALVKVWSHVGNRIFLQNIYTEDDGTINFPISNAGPWMVSTVKMIPSALPGADWQSMWASLVFEIE